MTRNISDLKFNDAEFWQVYVENFLRGKSFSNVGLLPVESNLHLWCIIEAQAQAVNLTTGDNLIRYPNT